MKNEIQKIIDINKNRKDLSTSDGYVIKMLTACITRLQGVESVIEKKRKLKLDNVKKLHVQPSKRKRK